MPRQKRVRAIVSREDPGAILPPEYVLGRAVLALIVDDAKCQNPRYGRVQMRAEARLIDQMTSIEALVDPEGGAAQWAALMNLDADYVRRQLCKQAGIPAHTN